MKETSTQPAEGSQASAREIKPRPVQLRSVSSLDQAAILMLSMGDEISAGILRNFSREEIISISQAMARLSNVKQPMVSDVISRFFDDYKEQSGKSSSTPTRQPGDSSWKSPTTTPPRGQKNR